MPSDVEIQNTEEHQAQVGGGISIHSCHTLRGCLTSFLAAYLLTCFLLLSFFSCRLVAIARLWVCVIFSCQFITYCGGSGCRGNAPSQKNEA